MSLRQRREIAYWFMLVVGMFIISIQLWRYASNTLSYSYHELIVDIIAVAFLIFPKFILNMAEKLIKSKTNEN